MTPLVNDNREVLVEARFSYHLNANATPIEQAIAWDFLMFVMRADNRRQIIASPLTHPTNRNVFYNDVQFLLPAMIREGFTWFTGTEEEGVDLVIAEMTAWGEMPMRSASLRPRVIDDIVAENMRMFHDGLLSAELTAQNLQNQITLVLMEMER